MDQRRDSPIRDRVVMRRVSDHLRDLATRVREIEDHLCTSANVPVDPEDPLVESLQRLDYLWQSLIDIGSLIDAIAEPGDARDRLLDDLTMESTRQLLLDRPAANRTETEPGAIDLF